MVLHAAVVDADVPFAACAATVVGRCTGDAGVSESVAPQRKNDRDGTRAHQGPETETLNGGCHGRAFVREAGNTADPRVRTNWCNVSLVSGGSKLRSIPTQVNVFTNPNTAD